MEDRLTLPPPPPDPPGRPAPLPPPPNGPEQQQQAAAAGSVSPPHHLQHLHPELLTLVCGFLNATTLARLCSAFAARVLSSFDPNLSVVEAVACEFCEGEGVVKPTRTFAQNGFGPGGGGSSSSSSASSSSSSASWNATMHAVEGLPRRVPPVPFRSSRTTVERGTRIIEVQVGSISQFNSFGQCPGARGDKWRLQLGALRKGGGFSIVLRGGVNAHHGILNLRVRFPAHPETVVALEPIDWYSMQTRHPVTKKTGSFAIPFSGHAVLEGEVQERNPSSHGFWMCLDSVAVEGGEEEGVGGGVDGEGQRRGAGTSGGGGGEEVNEEDDEDLGDDDDGDMYQFSWPFG